MDHEPKRERERENSFATTKPNQASPNDGSSLATPQVDASRSQSSVDLTVGLESAEYDMGSSHSVGNSSPPRNSSSYRPNSTPATDKTTKSGPKEQPPVLEPPVTKNTLSELDVNKIVHNPKLRHDINFDPDLHFRPNLDGEKGRKKKQKADAFWETFRLQLRDYLVDREGFEREQADAEWCLPATLNAIGGILETLVPQRDRSSVEETFNVDLLMQQFRKGVADLVKLASWLSQLLKCHCAPMRDDWVDDMVTQLSNGDRRGDVALLVSGMMNLLAVLEAMKLDVANHQIRCLRPLLIEDTVHFEQKFFMKKIALGRVDIAGAHAWFKRASDLPAIEGVDTSTHSQGNTWDFMKALVNLTLPSKSSEIVPHTFAFDEERLIKLRSDVLDLINLEICMQMYRGLEATSRMQEARSFAHDDTPVTSAASSPYHRPASPTDDNMLSSPTLPLEHHFTPKPRFSAIQERGHFSRAPSGQQVWIPNIEHDSIASSASPSPRSSPSTTASTPTTYPPTPFYLSQPLTDSASQARSSFHAILSSDTTSEKWSSLSSSLALQILRSTNTPLTRLPGFESHLAFHLSNPRSRCYQEAENRILSQIFPILHKLVETYTPLTSLQIFEAATVPKSAPGNLQPKVHGVKSEITEIATRIAHIGIMHWRVWAPLAYLVDPDAEEENLGQRASGVP